VQVFGTIAPVESIECTTAHETDTNLSDCSDAEACDRVGDDPHSGHWLARTRRRSRLRGCCGRARVGPV